jgi:hypothetical protein
MSVENAILDDLTSKPTAFLFSVKPPPFKSDAAKKMAPGEGERNSGFSHVT